MGFKGQGRAGQGMLGSHTGSKCERQHEEHSSIPLLMAGHIDRPVLMDDGVVFLVLLSFAYFALSSGSLVVSQRLLNCKALAPVSVPLSDITSIGAQTHTRSPTPPSLPSAPLHSWPPLPSAL